MSKIINKTKHSHQTTTTPSQNETKTTTKRTQQSPQRALTRLFEVGNLEPEPEPEPESNKARIGAGDRLDSGNGAVEEKRGEED